MSMQRRKVVGLLVAVAMGSGAPALGAQAEGEGLARVAEMAAQARETSAGIREAVARSYEAVARARAGIADGAAFGLGWASAPEPASPPAAWLQADPGDSLYRAAREALNSGEPRQAAARFQELRRRYPGSGYVGDSYYYEAYALQRLGGEQDLERALDLLEIQSREAPDAPTRRDARVLRTRVQGMLARLGNEEAAVGIQSQATEPCGDEDEDVRLMALNALLNMNAERAVPLLKEVLQSRGECSERLRKKAVFLLSQKMTDGTVDILLDLAQRNPDPSPEVREAAVFWLSQVHSEEATEALEGILRSSDDGRLQERALFALSQRPDERSLEILKSYAERSDAPEELREKAIFWLGQHKAGGPSYLRQLYPRLKRVALKEKVLFALSQERTDESRSWLLERARDPAEDPGLREKAVFWASQSGIAPGELRTLYESLDGPALREKVLFGLSQQHSTEAVDVLMDLARNEQDPQLRRKAIFWLGQSDDPRVTEFLMELVRGGSGS